MKTHDYPTPCHKCAVICTNPGRGCDAWRMWFAIQWKLINRQGKALAMQHTKRSVYIIPHPDEIRDYLRNSPCKTCKAEPTCDTPCPAYCQWWDTRMAYARKKVGF